MDIKYIEDMLAEYKTLPLINKLQFAQSPKWHTATEHLIQQNRELKSMVEKLRIIAESFNQKHCNYIVELDCTIQDVLDLTPPQALNAIRAEVAEECAELVDSNFNKVYDGDYLYEIDIANAIRNMARKYKEEG